MSKLAEGPALTPPVSAERDHVLGADSSAITLLEFADYQCPYCGQAYPIVKDVLAHFGEDLRYAIRSFPLSQVHPHAQRAAEAAEAAGAQGRFWDMHDVLFENQSVLDEFSLVDHARELGLALRRFVRELAGGVHVPRVREDFLSGVQSGVNGTPSFFVQGRRYDGPWDRGSFIGALEAERKAVRRWSALRRNARP